MKTIDPTKLTTPVFRFIGHGQNDDHYVDYEFSDYSRRHHWRHWVLTYFRETNEYAAVLRRSRTTTSPFDDGVELPQKMVAVLMMHTPAAHKVYFEQEVK